MTDIFLVILITPLVVMTTACIVGFMIRNISIVDAFWGLGIAATAWVLLALYPSSLLQYILTLLVTIWATRLAVFLILTRILKKEKDKRYTHIQKKWTRFKALRTLLHFYLQAILQSVICLVMLPFAFSQGSSSGVFQWVGVGLFFVAIFGESIADGQLFQFKQSKPSGICRKGLWSISRHPNYFFEFLIWLSLAFLSVGLPYFWIAFLSPLGIWIIMRYVTGPYTEKLSVKHRGESFKQYQREVPMIIPYKLKLWRISI